DVRRNDGAPARHLVADEISRQSFAQRDEVHLGRDLALPRVMKLRHALIVLPTADPRRSQFWKAALDVVVLRSAGVVHSDRRRAVFERDLTHRNADALRTLEENF